MAGVLGGFFAIWFVVGVGALLAQLQILGRDSQQVLSRLSFFAGNPALLLTMMSTADIRRLFATNLVVTVAATVLTAALYLTIAWVRWRPSSDHAVIGAFCSAYVNAGNMGLPIAAYVLGDVTWVAPLLLVQVGIIQPLGLAVLDLHQGARRPRALGYLALPLKNPMTVGVGIGMALNLTDTALPGVLATPLGMLGGLAVPTMLIAFGVSLRLGPLPGRSGHRDELLTVCVLKALVHPLLALGLAQLVGLDDRARLAVVVLAGLPTAQNVFTHAVRYDVEVPLARDAVFITSVATIGTVGVMATLL